MEKQTSKPADDDFDWSGIDPAYREYLWNINHSGPLEDVIEHVQNAQPPRCQRSVPKVVAKKMAAGVMKQSRVEHRLVEVTPSKEDIADFERAKAAILAELADIRRPFAGVCARYDENPERLGGYVLTISISAYDRME
jgi:hypothetical protein